MQCFNVPGPVPLLVLAGQLMLFNRAVKVIIYAHAGYQTVLLPAVHNLGVEIETGAFILLQDALADKAVEIYSAGCIDNVSIEINIVRQVYLRF